jgi:hypothetical protein
MIIVGELAELFLFMPLEWVLERQDARRRRAWVTVLKCIVLLLYVTAFVTLCVIGVRSLL